MTEDRKVLSWIGSPHKFPEKREVFLKAPVKKSKVVMSSWLFLTHPLFPSLL
jgi:hypothetical protein